MTVVNLSLSEIHDLALEAFTQNGCDPQNAGALTRTVVAAERDGSHSHGLFRVPGYVASLRSGKVNGAADPQISKKSLVILMIIIFLLKKYYKFQIMILKVCLL